MRAQAENQLDAINARRPEVDFAVARCLAAWGDLSTCRAVGMAMGPIPWTAIVAWCEFHDLDYDTAVLVIDVIRMVDRDRAEAAESKRRIDELRGGKR